MELFSAQLPPSLTDSGRRMDVECRSLVKNVLLPVSEQVEWQRKMICADPQDNL